MKLEINHKKNTEKHAKTWKLNNIQLNNNWVNTKIKAIVRDKEGNYILIKGTIQEEDITLEKHLYTQHRST